jgi:hypothetical protein
MVRLAFDFDATNPGQGVAGGEPVGVGGGITCRGPVTTASVPERASPPMRSTLSQRWHEQGPPQLKRGRSAQVC